VSTSFADYLRLYKASWLKLQQTTPGLSTYEDRALYSTWQLSFDHIKRQNELSTKLLQLWAYFDSQDLWFELLREGSSRGLEWLSQLTEDELSFNQAIRVLCNYGLADVDKAEENNVIESKGYSMHSCVHSWTISVLNQEWDAGMANLAVVCVGSHIPDRNAHNSWVTRRRLIRHAARCWSFVVHGIMDEEGRNWVLNSFGDLYSDLGRLNEAKEMYQRALQGYEKAWGPDHTSTLNTVNNLGTLYAGLGRLNEAEKMYQRALQGKERAWGLDHTSTLDTVNNLGALYADLGRLDEAGKTYQRALQGKEKAWGLDYTLTLNTVNNLGSLYAKLGRLNEAEKIYQRALQGYEKAWGPDYILTLDTVNNLGTLYADLGKLNKAEKIYQRALQGYEKAWGPDHTSTLNTVNNLGNVYADLGRLNEAEKMFQRALQECEKA